MKIIKKIIKFLLIILIILVFISPLWIKLIPFEYLLPLTGKIAKVDEYVCKYKVNVSGDSMNPFISPGSSIELNRCFDEEELTLGTVVLFDDNSNLRLGIIRYVLSLDPKIYKISNERPNERLKDTIFEEIIAINKDIDTGNSSYQLVEDLDSFIINPDEYVSELYLGKIPKGYGVEMAEVEKTDVFFKDSDKFCMVVIPKKELAFVNIEIIDINTKKAVISHKDIVFNVKPKPNTNCQDFGSSQGMLNLKEGSYRYRVLLNHQVLKDIQFTVK